MSQNSGKRERIPSIDRFRGMVIFCMIIFQFIAYFPSLGILSHFSTHAPDTNGIYFLPNYAIADIIAPMFIFAIALNYIPSFRRRQEKESSKSAVLHFLKRYLTLIGIGIVMNGINNILNGDSSVLNYFVMALTVLVLISAILTLVFTLAKLKAKKLMGNILGGLIVFAGALGVVLVTVNFIMLCTGKTDSSFGYWLVLHHIGFAGLVTLPFALIKGKKGTITRLIASAVILSLYNVFYNGNIAADAFASNREQLSAIADGGFAGGFAWGAMLMLFTVFSDIYYENKKSFRLISGVYILAAIGIIIGIFKTLPAPRRVCRAHGLLYAA